MKNIVLDFLVEFALRPVVRKIRRGYVRKTRLDWDRVRDVRNKMAAGNEDAALTAFLELSDREKEMIGVFEELQDE